jgi:hypothetical protein
MGHSVLDQPPGRYRPSIGRRPPLATIQEVSKWNKLRQAVKRQTNRKRVAKVGEVRGRFTVVPKSPNSPKVGNRRGRFTVVPKSPNRGRFTVVSNTTRSVARPPSLVNIYRKIEANILNLEDQVTNMRRRLRKNFEMNNLENKIYNMEQKLANHKKAINSKIKPLENKLEAAHKEAANLKKKINSARP